MENRLFCKKSLFFFCLLNLLTFSLTVKAQYSGYVGDFFSLPDPPDRYGYTAMNATFGSSSPYLYVDSYGFVEIRSYFTGTETVTCNFLYVKKEGYGTIPGTAYYTFTCNPRNITGLPSSITMNVGEQKTLNWSISPYSSLVQIVWSTGNSNIVTVSYNGTLEAKSAGSTTITAQNNAGPDASVIVTVKEDNTPVVSADVESGTVEKGTKVTLSCNKTGAEIYYTTDGTTPSKSSTRYVSPIVINETMTLKAIAYSDGNQSSVLIMNYTVGQDSGANDLDIVRNSISAGVGSIMFIKSDGTLWACGDNRFGKLGNGTTTDILVPEKIMDDVASVSLGMFHSLILKNDGTLWTCGYNLYGQLGDGSTTDRTVPIKVMGSVADITAGNEHSLILKNDGTLWTCGYNHNGQLGNGTRVNKSVPTKVMSNVVAIAAGSDHTLALKNDGTLWGCGDNSNGQLWSSPESSYEDDKGKWSFKNFIKLSDDVAYMYAGGNCTFVLKNDGILWACGSNSSGQLGNGITSGYMMNSLKITGMNDIASVASGSGFSHFLKTDGTVWASGNNRYGQLGNGDWSYEPVVTPVKIMEDVVSVSAGLCHSLFLKKDGSLWACGNNDRGQLGDGTTQDSSTPIKIMEGVGVSQDYEISLSTDGYATFFDSRSAYTLPNGLSAQVVTNVSEGKLTFKTIADGALNGRVPKGVPVMVISEDKQNGTFTLQRAENSTTYAGTNLLHGSDEATTTTGDGLHYKLSYGPSGTGWKDVFGWYWGAQNGAPFQIEGHKAWLVVPQGNGTRAAGFSVNGQAVGIETLDDSTISPSDDYFDLQGRRVSQPTRKGLYIKNGKKVVK